MKPKSNFCLWHISAKSTTNNRKLNWNISATSTTTTWRFLSAIEPNWCSIYKDLKSTKKNQQKEGQGEGFINTTRSKHEEEESVC